MQFRTYLVSTLLPVLLCFGVSSAASAVTTDGVPGLNSLTDYPRIENFEQGRVQVDFPSLDAWPDFRYLTAWLPVEVTLNGDSKPRVGSVYVKALTVFNFEQRTVTISDLNVLKTRFTVEDQPETVEKLLSIAFEGRESIVPLDVLLRLLPEDFEIPGQAEASPFLNFDPPVVVVSEKPLQLLSIDKEPVRAPLDGSGLEYVVNTNWNVFYYRPDAQWYVLNGDAWQQNNYLADGGWITTDVLPADFDQLSLNDDWPEVKKALPARKPAEQPVPFVISLQETELVLLDGAPRLSLIGETGISYVSNTQSDLFNLGDNWYYLVSGRWFSNTRLAGQWQAVKDLPAAFAHDPRRPRQGPRVVFGAGNTAGETGID